MAKTEYRRLSADNPDDAMVRYLNVYGYINPSGTVGRGYHEHLRLLWENGSR